jgi:tetratricopeptide (TPR) repeat protein
MNHCEMRIILSFFVLALLAVSPARGEVLAKKSKTLEPVVDSLTIFLQAGDSCMQQFNTFEALKFYQQAYALAKARSQQKSVEHLDLPLDKLEELPQERQDEIIEHLKQSAEKSAIVDCMVQMKLANCHYKRANYRESAQLLKTIPEDSLSHEAFRQLALSYKKLGDLDSYVYWAGQLVARYPMDGEMVAGLTLGYVQLEQPQNGLDCGQKYFAVDSTNIEVNRALADAYFMDRQFEKASQMYERLLQQGDSTFNTLYSAGMSYSRIDSLERAYKYLQLAFLISGMRHQGCAYRLGVVCVDTQRYPEGLNYLKLATEMMQPDTTTMKAITLSQGEGYYLSQHYPEAVEAWKRHLDYNPSSVATYFNIANVYAYILKDNKLAEDYYRQFIDLARQEEKPTQQLIDMMGKAEEFLHRPKTKRITVHK